MTPYVWLGCYDKVPKGEGYLYVHMSMGCTWMINLKFLNLAHITVPEQVFFQIDAHFLFPALKNGCSDSVI